MNTRIQLLLTLCTLLSPACGPSVRMIHQSNTYFERCHAADHDRMATDTARESCWTQWLRYYTSGQSPERVQFAQQRLVELRSGEPTISLPVLHAPAPTPAPVAPQDASIADASIYETPCEEVCIPQGNECRSTCRNRTCLRTCDIEQRVCLNACY